MVTSEKIAMENVNKPGGRTVSVDAEKYHVVKSVILAALPAAAPGLTLAELRDHIRPLLPEGTKVGWWMMGVQLDLRAKGVIAAEATKPMRLHRV